MATGNESSEPNQALMTGLPILEPSTPRKPAPPVRSAPRWPNAELTGPACGGATGADEGIGKPQRKRGTSCVPGPGSNGGLDHGALDLRL